MAAEAAAAPAATPAAPAADPSGQTSPGAPAQPVDPASEAGKTLAMRRAEIRAKLQAAAPASAPPETPAKTGATATSAPDADDDLAAIIREDRRVKAEAKKLAEQQAAHRDVEAMAPRLRAAEAKIKAGDKLGALKELFPGENLGGEKGLLWDLLKDADETPSDGAVDIEKLVGETIEKREQAAREAAAAAEREAKAKIDGRIAAVEEKYGHGFYRAVTEAAAPMLKGATPEQVAEVAEAYGQLAHAVGEEFTKTSDKYPAVGRFGVPGHETVRAHAKLHLELGRVPSTTEALERLEADLVEKIKGTPYAAAMPASPGIRPSETVTNEWRSNVGRPPAPEAEQTIEQRRAAIRKRLLTQ